MSFKYVNRCGHKNSFESYMSSKYVNGVRGWVRGRGVGGGGGGTKMRIVDLYHMKGEESIPLLMQ